MFLATGQHRAIALTIDGVEEKKRCETSLAEFVKCAWHVVEPPGTKLIWNWHLDVICAYMEAVYAGDIKRLIVNIPPGTMKSLVIMVFYPSWVWTQRQGERFLCGTNDGTLATRDAVRMRQLITSEWYKSHWGAKVQLSVDQQDKGLFANTYRGHRESQSILGKVTGKRGSCIAGHVSIETEQGPIAMELLCSMPSPPRVWTFNIETGSAELQAVVATRKLTAVKTIDVCTLAGNLLTCTPDHLIFASGNYAKAESVAGCSLSIMQRPNRTAQRAAHPMQLMRKSSVAMHNMRDWFSAGWRGNRQACPQGIERRAILQQGLQQADKKSPADRKAVRTLWQQLPSSLIRSIKEVLQQGLLLCGPIANKSLAAKALCSVWIDDDNHKHTTQVLRNVLQKQSPLGQDARFWQFPLYKSNQPRWTIQAHGFDSIGKGLALLRSLWNAKRLPAAVGSPHRPRPGSQRAVQSNQPVQLLSQHTPQVYQSACWIEDGEAEGHGSCPVDVYDIQVAANSNFFAGGILVHNCLLWDDPHDANSVESDVQRQSVIDAYDQGWSSRRNDLENSPIVIVMQRVHYADITGHLLKKGNWTRLAIPMRFDPDTTYDPVADLNRPDLKDPRTEAGQLLFPQKFPEVAVKELEANLGSYGTAGQLQQNPSPKGGGILRSSLINLWPNTKPLPIMQYIVQSYDTAFTEDTMNDPTACTVWGVFWHEGKTNIMLIDCWQEHMEYPALRQRVIKEWSSKYAGNPKDISNPARSPDIVLIEKKGSGQSLLQDLSATKIRIAGYNPGLAGKVARAHLITPIMDSGVIWIIESKAGDSWPTWATWLEKQIDRFPNDEHDDGVDTMTQALRYLKDSGFVSLSQSERIHENRPLITKEKGNPYAQ